MRRFAVLLGATAPATAAALSATFFGLGLGSYVFGRLATRLSRPLRAFALLELATGLTALALEPSLAALQRAQAWLYAASGPGEWWLLAGRAGLAMLAVSPPAICMGGTLPLLAQHVAARAESLGVRAGGLYAVNTFGAALGALAVPTWLLPRLGAQGALAATAATSLMVGAGAAALAQRTPARAPGPAVRPPGHEARVPFVPVALAFASGLITIGFEALAARAFALVHENSVYSFASVVAVFLLGLAMGAALSRAALARGVTPRALLTAGWGGAGATIALVPASFVKLTGLDYLPGGSLLGHELHLVLLAGSVLLVPCVLSGLALPALMQELGESRGAGGPAIGIVLAANTVGAILGPLLSLFLLAPEVGLWGAVVAVGGVSVACGLVAAPGAGRPAHALLAAAAVVALGATLLAPPTSLPRTSLSGGERLLEVREGALGTVAVVERGGQRRIKLNNYYVLGGTAAATTERLQGHIPLLLHPHPDRVAFLGIGTGISLSAVRLHPVKEAVALELVPEVIEAASRWFADANLGVLSDPRVRVRAEDARSYLGATPDRFDVVVGDLVVPWRRGEASLYTRESFEAVRRVLAPGGLYCQWLPLYQLAEPEFDSIVASFLDVFPLSTLWHGGFDAGAPSLALIGHTTAIDVAAADRRVGRLAATRGLGNPYLSHPAGLWLYFIAPLDPSDRRLRDAPRNSDSRPWVELVSPRLHLRIERGDTRPFVARELKGRLDAMRSAPLPATSAASLDARHLEWRALGAELWGASLLSFEGDDAAADRKGLAALRRLPQELQSAVLGGPRH